MKETIRATALAAVLLLPSAPQQTPPPVTSFAGTWTGDITRNASARYVGGLGLERLNEGFTIAQDAKTLAVTRTHVVVDILTGGPKTVSWTLTYRLDAAESPNSGFYFQHTVSTAHWDGDSLVVATKDPKGDSTTVFSMDGPELKMVTTEAGPSGSSGLSWTLFFKKGG